MNLPKEIETLIGDYSLEEITKAHCSGDFVYKVEESYILKVSNNYERLLREKQANDFLQGKLPVSKSVAFVEQDGQFYYLKTLVKGQNLVEENYLRNPILLAELLAKAVKMVHSIDVTDCPLKDLDSEGTIFIHGDMCLPNILAIGEEVSGFIDTEACGIGDPWMDYAWCIWSYEYNLGTTKYTPILLKKLGIVFDEQKYTKYTS